MSNPFQIEFANSKRMLKRHETFDKLLRILSFGIFNNSQNLNKYLEDFKEKQGNFYRYVELINKAEHLKESEDFTFDNIRIGKEFYSDLSVIGQEDYGPDWDILRRDILERDDFVCQEADGYCIGALQVHHLVPLTKGGTNSKHNLITLCLYHHSLKHEHMKNKL